MDYCIAKDTTISIDNSKVNKKNIFKFDSLLEKGNKIISSGINKFRTLKINPDDMHILLFTSGTTRSS